MLRRDRFLIRNTPAAPAIARRYVDETLADAPRGVVDLVALMVSELTTNCVRYVTGDFTMSIERTENAVRVDVADDECGDRVKVQNPTPDEPTGRGLCIVEQLSDDWGVSPMDDGEGKSVWFTLRLS